MKLKENRRLIHRSYNCQSNKQNDVLQSNANEQTDAGKEKFTLNKRKNCLFSLFESILRSSHTMIEISVI